MKKNISLIIIGLIIGALGMKVYLNQEIKDLKSMYLSVSTDESLIMLELLREKELEQAIKLKEERIKFEVFESTSPFSTWAEPAHKETVLSKVKQYQVIYPQNQLKEKL